MRKIEAYRVGPCETQSKVIFHFSQDEAKEYYCDMEGVELEDIGSDRLEEFDKYIKSTEPQHFDQSNPVNHRAFYDNYWFFGEEQDICSYCTKGIYDSIPESKVNEDLEACVSCIDELGLK